MEILSEWAHIFQFTRLLLASIWDDGSKSQERPDGWYMKHELNDTTNNQSASTSNCFPHLLEIDRHDEIYENKRDQPIHEYVDDDKTSHTFFKARLAMITLRQTDITSFDKQTNFFSYFSGHE